MAKKEVANDEDDLNIKKPQLSIPLDRIDLDDENPRLGDECLKGTQPDLLAALFSEFDLEEIGLSMAENGYFDEEPIVVVPKNLPKDFKGFSSFDNITNLQDALNDLIQNSDLRFVVVEGNRRIATAKILTSSDVRNLLKIKSNHFPVPKNDKIEKDLLSIPGIIYENREIVSPYLGVRHIIGNSKWDAFPTALYITKQIEQQKKRGLKINAAIEVIQRKTGDRSDKIKKQLLYYKIYKEAQDGIDVDLQSVKRRFSLLEVAMRSPAIREYIDAKNYNEIDFDDKVISAKKYDKFQNLMTWIFGDGKGKDPIITDSRKITSVLAKILSHYEATEHLEKTSNLDDAYELSDGEKDMFYRKLRTAKNSLTTSLGFAFKYKNEETEKLVEEIGELLSQIKKMIKK